ncbi:BED-type domain-containing protein [Trichonephila clavipes]|nr:BED-type domain-containing protein [Trichonephila clavipes]
MPKLSYYSSERYCPHAGSVVLHSYLRNQEKKLWNIGLTHVSRSIPAEKCVEVLKSKLAKHGLSLKENIVSRTTDGATIIKKVGKLIGANHQFCYSHGIQLGVINVLYQKNKEQKNSITVGRETSNSDFDESESDTDNEEEFGTVIEDDDDTNINSEKELSFGQKLELAITQKISTNQNTGQKAAVSKTIGREIDLSEDEGFRGKYLEKKYIAHC